MGGRTLSSTSHIPGGGITFAARRSGVLGRDAECAALDRALDELPADLALLTKALIMGEGLAPTLEPDFQIGQAVAPFARRPLLAQLSPTELLHRLERAALAAAEFPSLLHRVPGSLGDGVDVHVRTTAVEPLVDRLERLGNRIAVSVRPAAAINSVPELAAADRIRPSASHRPRAAPATAPAALGGYAAWRRNRSARRGAPIGRSYGRQVLPTGSPIPGGVHSPCRDLRCAHRGSATRRPTGGRR